MENYCVIKGIHPLLVGLVSSSSLTINQRKDLDVLLHAMTRFMKQETPIFNFKDDSEKLIEDLNRLVSGCHVRGLDTYTANEPMHFEHLLKAFSHTLLNERL